MTAVRVAAARRRRRLRRYWTGLPLLLLYAPLLPLGLTGCAGAPVPDWQLNARGALDRAAAAYLVGDRRVEAAEFARARADVARTGRADLLATLELSRCAWRVASLSFDDGCPGFEALAVDAGAAERVYADYLAGRTGSAADVALLPAPQRQAASVPANGGPFARQALPATAGAAELPAGPPASATTDSAAVGAAPGDPAPGSFAPVGAAGRAVAAIDDPLSRLVAAGVLLRRGAADPAVLATAIETASSQGWSRPLLAWLHAERLRAQAAGEGDAAARIGRRIARIAPPTAAASASGP